jgi:rhodanese-related sulfurtransferase
VAYTETMSTPDPATTTDADDDADADAEGSAIAGLLEASRAELDRVEPDDLDAEVAAGALVVDIRPVADREADGSMPGAIAIERIHLEWRLDPTSPHRIPEATPGRRVIVMCNEGYASSLAAVTLRTLGVTRATDLAGGYRAWAALGSASSSVPDAGSGTDRDRHEPSS